MLEIKNPDPVRKELRAEFEKKTKQKAFTYSKDIKGYVLNLNYLEFIEDLIVLIKRKTKR